MINVVIMGVCGRMGKANIDVFSEDSEIKVVGAVERPGSEYIGMDAGNAAGLKKIGVVVGSELDAVIEKADVIVDFTNPEATLQTLEHSVKYKKAVVIGTTGFSEEQRNTIKEYSKEIAVLLSPNMSQGVNILFYLVKKAAELLGDEYDVELFEIHHNQKQDAPSGTALRFGRLIAETRGKTLEDVGVFSRKGRIGKRKMGEIGIMALRLADAPGDHTVIFGGPGERIEFTHRNISRRTYASGALKAVKFLAVKDNGLFGMEDVLGIRSL
ncbi:MAG: 4-hydroxy-tetrahydrodipicolinate reductase [Spirochaetota bacterium]|nr:MAG: 4-hydroxy-tetrahydrodipicolinate reductase [Spirochaetota bacterium]